MTRAKFECREVSKQKGWGEHAFVYAAKFQAVTGRDVAGSREAADENAQFFAATPSGSIELSTVRQNHFEVGKTYYVDFSEAEA